MMASTGLAPSRSEHQAIAEVLALDGEHQSDAEHQSLVAADANQEQASPPHAPVVRDHLTWFFALDPATRCVFSASCSFAFLLLMSFQLIKLAVYFVALLPGFLMCRRALHVYRHEVTQESFARSILAGLSLTVLVFLCELAAVIVLELLSFLAFGYATVSYVAITSLVEAFVIAAWFEEKTKASITQRAIRFENAANVSSILAHSIAGATAFATLENVIYLSMSSPGITLRGITLSILFIRTFICVPLHICWGISNGAGIAIAKLAPEANTRLGDGLVLRLTAGPFSVPASRVSLIGPSVVLHGLWDFPLFMARKSGAALKAYCEATKQPLDWCSRNDSANSLNMERLVGVIMSFIFLVMIPIVSLFLCWRRVKLLRAIESADFTSVLRQVQVASTANAHPPVLQQSPIAVPSVSLWSRTDVATWLSSAGLQQYQDAFKPVNGAVLLTLSDSDLQELGVSVAVHRRAVMQLIEEDGPQMLPSQPLAVDF